MVPLLATDDTAVAAEINALAASMPGGASRDMDELLYDLGTLAAAPPPAGPAAADGDDDRIGATTAMGAMGACADAKVLEVLVPHLLSYVEAMGLSATAASIRTGLTPPPLPLTPTPLSRLQPQRKEQQQQQQQLRGVLHVAAVGQEAAGVANDERDGDDDDRRREGAAGCQYGGRGGKMQLEGGSGGSGGGGGLRLSAIMAAVLQVLGLQAVSTSAAASYEVFLRAWNVTQGHTM
ncbi:hypothetical protein VOLCADRAFT_101529 [Volvox carteri f. nagariensis]|uniref:Uncharacterized protein n=1 Tax=Volvox carteri f. nagariensis TaxID=3068 RepID=D8UMY1_VOLCA|nr:uncharacterized protein VOLCADRAFT_101529 [Volvox carteri f. nagariensis]EFJ38918.1 hypothetical protein VOLCADRAFT_101529 [Volvox carteri f. nagariensis]|eukprot:XP_002960017.1 hypothetical protein VOLCADRAFT_101529 [Volvox carteri f. nagariensis]